MAEESIKPGDVVQLKSGGKRMTVSTINGDEVICLDDKAKRMTFPLVTLKKWTPPKAGASWLGTKR